MQEEQRRRVFRHLSGSDDEIRHARTVGRGRELLLDRHAIVAGDAVYIDDNPKNAAAATALGLHGIHYTGPEALRRDLLRLGLLGAEVPVGA